MKRSALIAALVLAAGLAPARGAVEVELVRTVNVWLDGFSGNGQFSLYATARTGMTLIDADTDPIDDVQIHAFWFECDEMDGCTNDSWSGTAGVVDLDPAGNSAQVTACLAPEGGGPCAQFDLSFRRPGYTNPTSCTTIACVNAWVDDEDPAAEATVLTSMYRTGYQEMSGLWAGSAFDAGDYTYVNGNSAQHISARAHVEP